MNDILTKSQELRKYGKTLEALKELEVAPESKDLLKSIRLGENDYSVLYITNLGLVKINNIAIETRGNPSIDLIKEYNLTEKELVNLLARLRA